MTPSVSVVVVSLGRPAALRRCVSAIRQLRYRPYEVIVVADEAGCDALSGHSGLEYLRIVPNEADGVAAARNLGIERAAGAIVAFIDDDAVPEPMWLDHLVTAFDAPSVGAATGYVRGRNGISYQWRARTIGRDGHHGSLTVSDGRARVRRPETGAVMLEGTNMALRRSVLEELGGFDSRFRFYLDDADMALRVHDHGLETVVVPNAEVHHGFLPSRRRRADRTPTDLFDNGRSLAIFLRKHAPDHPVEEFLRGHRDAERRRLIACMVDGRCDPRDVARLLAGFDEGVRAGLGDVPGPTDRLETRGIPGTFRSDTSICAPIVLAGRAWSRRTLRRRATAAAASGRTTSLFLFSPTALYHKVCYRDEGFWEQSGGLFGRSERRAPLLRITSFGKRLRAEVERVAEQRGMKDNRGIEPQLVPHGPSRE